MESQADVLSTAARFLPSYLQDELMSQQVQGQRVDNQSAVLKNQAAAAELADQANYLHDVQLHFGTNPTEAGAAYMAARYPRQHEAVKAAAGLMQDDHARREITSLGSVWQTVRNAMNEQDPDKRNYQLGIARGIVQSRIDADIKSGHAPDDDQHALELLNAGDQDSLSMVAGMAGQAVAALRPENYGATLKAQGDELRADQTQPLEVRSKAAEANTKEAQAASAPDYYPAQAQNERAQAQTNQAEAASAPTYYRARSTHEAAQASISLTDSASEAADRAATIGLKTGELASLKSLISLRAQQEQKLKTEVTVGDVMAPITIKVAKGQPLTPGEAAAYAAYTHAPASQRLMNQPKRGPAAASPPASSGGSSPVKYFTNRQTGAREAFHLVDGRWQKM